MRKGRGSSFSSGGLYEIPRTFVLEAVLHTTPPPEVSYFKVLFQLGCEGHGSQISTTTSVYIENVSRFFTKSSQRTPLERGRGSSTLHSLRLGRTLTGRRKSTRLQQRPRLAPYMILSPDTWGRVLRRRAPHLRSSIPCRTAVPFGGKITWN